jgi:SAM-dependent methyltransferase
MSADRTPMGELRLNVGAGTTYLPGFRNIDVSARAEIRLDLGRDPLPFEDDSVDCIFSYHTLEHIDDYLFALGELHRVLRHGGRLLIGVPYVSLTEYHLINPYHRHNFSEHSFDFFELGKLKGSAAEEGPILLTKVFHRCHYFGRWGRLPEPLRRWARRHLLNVVQMIDFGLYAVKPPHTGFEVGAGDAARLTAEFDDCLRRRQPYP